MSDEQKFKDCDHPSPAPVDAGLVARLDEDAEMLRVVKPRGLLWPLGDYWRAPGEINNPDMFSAGYTWADKPHRLLYDLIANILLLRAENARLIAELAEARAGLLVSERHCDILTGDRAVLAEAANCAETECDDQCARRVEVMRELNETRARLAAAESALLKLANAADVVGVEYFDTDTLEPPIQALHDATIAARAAIRTLPAERPGKPEMES